MKATVFALACLLLAGQTLGQAPGSAPPTTAAAPPQANTTPTNPNPAPPNAVVPPTTATPPTPATTTAASKAPSSGPARGPSPNAASLTPGSGSTPTDADILYFAYNLEIFEANFYSCAASGTGVSSQYTGGGPAPIGCQKANLTSNVGTYAAELAREESAHVALLYTALKAAGANPVAPEVDISAATFNKAAELATNSTTLNPEFDPYANDYFFLHAAFIFEDLGTSAYLGALNSISNSSYRLTAAQIGAAEAYHASLDRTLLYQVLNVVPAYNLTVANITSDIVALENSVALAPQIKYNIYNNQGSQISNVDSNGLVPAASAQQVLRVVTLGAPSGSGGGFFPQNLNGNVKN